MKNGLFILCLVFSGCATNQAYYQSIYDRCMASGRDDFYCSEYSAGLQRQDNQAAAQIMANYYNNMQQQQAVQYNQANQNLQNVINRPAGITNTNCYQDYYGNVNCTSNSW